MGKEMLRKGPGSGMKKKVKSHRPVHDVAADLEKALEAHRAGRLETAEPIYRGILRVSPNHPDALHLLGVLAYQTGRFEAALDLVGKAIRSNPHTPHYYDSMGNVLKALSRLEEAITHYKKAIRLNPEYAGACNNLANALKAVGKTEEATLYYRKALEINPGLAEPYNNLGNLLKDRGEMEEAVSLFRRAIDLKPDYGEAYNNLGIALHALGRIDESVRAFTRAVELNPAMAETFNNLGNLCRNEGRVEEAVSLFAKALDLKPGYAQAHNNLGLAFQDSGLAAQALAHYRMARDLDSDDGGYWSNCLLAMHYTGTYSREELFEEAVEWGRKNGLSCPAPAFANTADPGRPLRIGYVSGDFRRHPVGYFIEPVITFHDRGRYEIYCYANQYERDDLTMRLETSPARFRRIADVPDGKVEEMIRRDGIDILIDLSGHTARNRLLLFVRKPAPVRASWIGYSDTTGLDAMDYIIADRHVIPEGDEKFYTEKVIRLPHSYLCYYPPAYAPEVTDLPAFRRGFITFGSFNNVAKVSAATIDGWAEILRAVPGSRLCIKTSILSVTDLTERYVEAFSERGIDPGRIEVAGKSPDHRGLLDRYGEIDIALDTFPYGGTTTTAEALWMGVPVVTLVRGGFVGRTGSSILRAVGLGELTASDEGGYVEKARALAEDRGRLAALRATLREKMRISPLCGMQAFTRDVENLFRTMWAGWCEGGPSQ